MRNDFGVSEWTLLIPVAVVVVTFLVLILLRPRSAEQKSNPWHYYTTTRCGSQALCGHIVAGDFTTRTIPRITCEKCLEEIVRIVDEHVKRQEPANIERFHEWAQSTFKK